ncbi:MAG: hypothetical protein ACR2NZ_16055 [Rubripirellula sp.]
MANPYQTPQTTSEPIPGRSSSPILKVFAALAVGVGTLGFGYGCLIMGFAMLWWDSKSTTSVPRGLILLLGFIILSFGAGLGLGGVGLWSGRTRWSATGGLLATIAISAYLAIVFLM